MTEQEMKELIEAIKSEADDDSTMEILTAVLKANIDTTERTKDVFSFPRLPDR